MIGWLVAACSAALLFPTAEQAPVAGMSVDGLATGQYSRMHMLLEKTIFGFDVLTVEIRFDESTAQRFRGIAAGHEYSDALADRIAKAAVEAENAFVAVEFDRDVSLDRWIEGVRESLGKALRWGVIDRETYRRTSEQLPNWFRVIAERGYKQGDRLLYRVRPDSLHTVLVGRGGEILVDQTDRGTGPRRALLGGYFAPGTDFRKPLIESLFEADAGDHLHKLEHPGGAVDDGVSRNGALAPPRAPAVGPAGTQRSGRKEVAVNAQGVVFELNVAGEEQWEGVLTNVANLLEAVDGLQVEVVVHGEALPVLLRGGSRLSGRVEELHRKGVRFSACENTMRRRGVSGGQLLPPAQTVDSGVAQVVRRQIEGWAYIKGGR